MSVSTVRAPDQASTKAGVRPFARWAVLPIAAVVAIAQFIASTTSGYWFDEAYMLAIGRNHLDWGSADQPPIAPLLAALMDWIAPGSTVAIRLPAVLSTAAAVVVAALIARELGGDRRAQTFTAGAQATSVWIAMAGHWITPYTLEPLQWLLLFWVLVRWLRSRDDRLLLLLGVVAGIAAETKFQVLLLCAVLVISVLVVGPREMLGRPLLWAGAGIGVLIALPTLIWQAVNGWPQLKMSSVVISEADALFGGRPGVALGLVVMAGVAGTVLSLYGLWRLLRAEELRSYRFFAVTVLVLYVFFIAAPGRPYYLCGVYGLLAAFGALGLQQRREAGRHRLRWVAWPAYALSAAAAIGIFTTPVAAVSADIGEKTARRTADAYQALSPDEQRRTVIMGQSYIDAAYIDGYSTEFGMPKAYSTNRGYGYFPEPSERQDSVLYVGRNPDELRPYFTGVRRVDEGGDEPGVWLCTGKQESWTSLWERLRHLGVQPRSGPPA